MLGFQVVGPRAPYGERMDGCSGPVGDNVRHILETIRSAAARSARNPDSIRVIAATKAVDVERIQEAMSAGITLVGENRLQEALPKIERLGREHLSWHFIGRLQRRKVKLVVGRFELIHSVDSLDLAEEINRRAEQAGLSQSILLEVNIGGEKSKGGWSPGSVAATFPELSRMTHLRIQGLMTIPPPAPDAETARPYFRQLRELGRSLTRSGFENINMDELSMGMSGDYHVAVEEGATYVRIGTAIFGARRG
ncbi:MAG: YggS family pyridoxal phosphate-dependent enzyme [Nitrospiraceae bacterium]